MSKGSSTVWNITTFVKYGHCSMCGKEGMVVNIGGYWICDSNLCYKMLVKLKYGGLVKGR